MKRTLAAAALVLFGALLASGVQAQEARQKQNVAILIFDGVQIIDYTGPYEVLGGMGRRHVYTVAERADPVTTNMGMRVIPNYTFENQPRPDIIIVPGGGSSEPGERARGVGAQLENRKVINWIQAGAKEAKYVMSVCNGAFLLAKAGLLDGLEATTTAGLVEKLRGVATKTRVVNDKRFVDNGKIITTGGLSSGIDGALHLIEKIDGKGWAQMSAYGIEYDWRPESGYARASHADQKLPAGIYDLISSDFEPLSFVGGADSWEEKWGVPANMSAAELLARVGEKWATDARWAKANVSKVNNAAPASVWKLTDEKGQAWEGSASVEQAGSRPVLVLKVVRGANGARARLN